MRLKIFGVFVPFFLIYSSVYASVRCDGVLPDTTQFELTVTYNSDCSRNFEYKSNVVERLATLAWGKASCSMAQGVWDSNNFSTNWDYGVYVKINTYTHYLYGVRFSVVLLDPQNTDTDGDGVKDFFDAQPNNPLVSDLYDPGSDDDGDGVLDCIDQCPGTPDNVVVNSQGCPDPCVDNDGDGIPYAFDFAHGLVDDYYFNIGRTANDSYVTIYIPEKDKLYTYGQRSDSDIMIIDVKRYHSSDLSWLLDCEKVTFNPNQPHDPVLKNDFKKDLEEEKYKPENETSSDSGVDKPIDPKIDIPAGEEGNYATRFDASAIEKAMKENTNITRQSVSATRKKIDELIQSGSKNKNDIVDAINNIGLDIDVDIDAEEIGNQVAIQIDEKYRSFSDEQSTEIDSESENIFYDLSDFYEKTGINPNDDSSVENFVSDKIDSVMLKTDSDLSLEEKLILDEQYLELQQKTDFDKFDINLNSSKCSYTADLGEFGSFEISICEYEQYLCMVGNVFYFAFALVGYVVLLRS